MQDQTPITWEDGVTGITDSNMNQEIRNAAQLILNPPMCGIYMSASQGIPAGTYMSVWTPITFDTAYYDTEDPSTPMWYSPQNNRLTIRTPGYYECIACAEETGLPNTNIMTGAFRINGSTIYLGNTAGRISENAGVSISNLIAFNANDYIQFVITHDYGSTITLSSGFQTSFYVARRRGL